MRISMPCHIYEELLLKRLMDVVKRFSCDCIALSGGIDTSVILLASVLTGLKPRGYLVIYRNGLPKDVIYVNHIAKVLNIHVEHLFVDSSNVEEIVQRVVECIGKENIDSHGDGGCIEIRNDIVFYTFLSKAIDDGCKCIFTGSGGDEIFVGYSFMMNKVSYDLEKTREKLAYGRYPELEIGKCVGAKVVAPFLEESVLELAFRIPINCLRSESMLGKEILRQILEKHGLHFIANRVKTPAESGAGTKAVCKSIYDE
ncbi:asparagine synthase-related protein [Ignisphaera sp. 4213-co]|uniref:Asparagine synthase-related protein n=1 Tax=Ignisphaera cupida TaxID=3050454 RepID=A0ABD4Z5C4_9CREN|nr:asparagine synthase-related protein [Ignisphaera sp. 4213-co]MDK6028314.1 asparagine synthase-related protein [Ignisphaera sp. 4213-co]